MFSLGVCVAIILGVIAHLNGRNGDFRRESDVSDRAFSIGIACVFPKHLDG